MGDNASLRRETKRPLDDRIRIVGTSSSFDTTDVDIDTALAFVQTIGEGDGHQIQPLLSLLEVHMANVEFCSQLCTALESLTFTNMDHRKAILRYGGIEAVLRVMEQHQDADPRWLRPAMDALWNLTFDDEVVTRVSEAGGIERVLAVLLNLASKEAHRRQIVQSGAPLV